jgi:polysaccharide biosynthesis protein PslG
MLQLSRKTRALMASLVVVVALGAGAASATALPAKFFGVVPQSVLSLEQFKTLEEGNVETMRVPMMWPAIQGVRGNKYEWSSFDPLMERAAETHMELLPFVIGTPPWAVPNATIPGTGGGKAPAHLPATGTAGTAFSNFLKAAVGRYGEGGTFWAEHPLLPADPINAWQIWNEPNFKYFVAKPNPTEYGKLVKLSSKAIKSVDPSAEIILAGLFAKPNGARHKAGKKIIAPTSPNYFAAYFLEQMYKTNPGIKSSFQGVSLHPYVGRYRALPAEIEETRKVLIANGDPNKGLWITELGWSSEPPQPGAENVFQVGPAGQARELKGAFTLLKADVAKYRLKHVYWFSVDDAPETCNFCNGSGLFKKGFVPKKSWTEFVKFTGGTP